MKLGEPSRLTPESLPDWPKGESLSILLDALNSNNEQTTQALQQNLTIGDNMNAAIVTKRLTHATELSFPNPLKVRPVGISVIRSAAINGGERHTVQSLDWRFVDSSDPTKPQQIGVTVSYAPPSGGIRSYRNAALSVATNTAMAPDTQIYQYGDMSFSTANGIATARKPGLVRVSFSLGYNASAGGTVRGAWIWSTDGVAKLRSVIPSAGATSCVVTGSTTFDVSTGTKIQILADHDTGGTVALTVGNDGRCVFEAQYVGPTTTAKNDVTFVVYGG